MDDSGDQEFLKENIGAATAAIAREKAAVMWLGLIGAGVASWLFGDAMSLEGKIIAGLVLGGFLLVHGQLCDLRTEGLLRELRALHGKRY